MGCQQRTQTREAGAGFAAQLSTAVPVVGSGQLELADLEDIHNLPSARFIKVVNAPQMQTVVYHEKLQVASNFVQVS